MDITQLFTQKLRLLLASHQKVNPLINSLVPGPHQEFMCCQALKKK